jgi:3-deoxy-7-phosphoheptulonate synthase
MDSTKCDNPVEIKKTALELTRRNSKSDNTIIDVNGVKFGGEEFVVIAGPCAVENREQLLTTAQKVQEYGAKVLRGGAFKPRTNPYSFQGLEEEGLQLLAEARKMTGLPIVTEVMDTRQVELVSQYADILQIGSRNMNNYPLLKEVGNLDIPVLFKRGMMATVNEYLMAAEYILSNGNENVILCERGIRTFEPSTRNTLDLSSVLMLKHLSHLPVCVDPSHGTGVRWMIPEMAKAALAVGADAIMVEVHYQPEKALCDGEQSLYPEDFARMIVELDRIGTAVGRRVIDIQPVSALLVQTLTLINNDLVAVLSYKTNLVCVHNPESICSL